MGTHFSSYLHRRREDRNTNMKQFIALCLLPLALCEPLRVGVVPKCVTQYVGSSSQQCINRLTLSFLFSNLSADGFLFRGVLQCQPPPSRLSPPLSVRQSQNTSRSSSAALSPSRS